MQPDQSPLSSNLCRHIRPNTYMQQHKIRKTDEVHATEIYTASLVRNRRCMRMLHGCMVMYTVTPVKQHSGIFFPEASMKIPGRATLR